MQLKTATRNIYNEANVIENPNVTENSIKTKNMEILFGIKLFSWRVLCKGFIGVVAESKTRSSN